MFDLCAMPFSFEGRKTPPVGIHQQRGRRPSVTVSLDCPHDPLDGAALLRIFRTRTLEFMFTFMQGEDR